MMKERHLMPIVDDLGLSDVTDRAARVAAKKGLVTGADLMMHLPRARRAWAEMKAVGVSVGVHIDLFPNKDPNTNAPFAQAFREAQTAQSTKEGRKKLTKHTIKQIKMYQDMTGENPPHISTHNHTHLDNTWPGNVFPEFIDAVHEAVGGEDKTLIRSVDLEQVRHCRAGELKAGREPDSPEAFYKKLLALRDVDKPLDLLVHPGLPLMAGEEDLGGGYPLNWRIKDLDSLAVIIGESMHHRAGYRLTSPEEYLEIRSAQWPDSMWPIDPSILLSLPSELRPSNKEINELKHPWKLLEEIQHRLHERVVDTRIAEGVTIDKTAKIENNVWLEPGVVIGPQVILSGPLVVGAGTKIVNGSTVIRSVIGPHGLIGTNSEISRSVLGNRSSTHNAGFLDSIGGDGVHLATSRTSNQRIDHGEIVVFDSEETHNTGRRKLGMMAGSFSTLGTFTSTDPGTRVGRETIIGAYTRASGVVPDRSRLTTETTQVVISRE